MQLCKASQSVSTGKKHTKKHWINRSLSGKRPRKQCFPSFCIVENTEHPQSPRGCVWAGEELVWRFWELKEKCSTFKNTLLCDGMNRLWSLSQDFFNIFPAFFRLFAPFQWVGADQKRCRSEHQSETRKSSAGGCRLLISLHLSLCLQYWLQNHIFIFHVWKNGKLSYEKFWKPPSTT